MAWYSILPEYLAYIETYAIKAFIFLALLNIAPWLLAILYDFLLYAFRTIAYETPVVGGRAKGEQRPRAPSLSSPSLSKKTRRLSLVRMISDSTSQSTGSERPEMGKRTHSRNLSSEIIQEE